MEIIKNKKKILTTILLLFAISGLCNIINVSAFTDTIYIPSSSYVYYSLGYLDIGDKFLINEIDSNGGIDVLIMTEDQFYLFDGYSYTCEYSWENIVYLSGWEFIVYESGDNCYIILWNRALLTGRDVYVDISIDYYEPYTDTPPDIRPIIALIVTIGVISGISVLTILLVIKNKKKKREVETQVQEVIKPKSFYCSNCGAENIDITNDYCSKCGSKIIR